MEKLLVHTYEIPVKGVSKKIIYQFNDVHLALCDEMSDEAETEAAKAKTSDWERDREIFAGMYSEPYGEMQKVKATTHFENMIEEAKNGDALLLAGDIIDYANGANTRFLDDILGSLSVPYMYVAGNHEPVETLPDNKIFSEVKKPIQIIEFDDMVILGVDNSKREITSEQNETVEKILKSGKPTLVLMHVPIMTSANEELLMRRGPYFRLNHDEAPEENQRFIETIKENAQNVIAVLAGHLHFGNISEICENVTQYVSSQGLTGNINRYVIGC